jgi:hypothetical protein
VLLIIYGIMPYFKNKGPSTNPPAIPVHPHRTEANIQINTKKQISAVFLNLTSYGSYIYPSLSFIS